MPAALLHGKDKTGNESFIATMPIFWNLYMDCRKARPKAPPKPDPLPPVDPSIPTGPTVRVIYLIGDNWGTIEIGPDGPILKPPKDDSAPPAKKKGKIDIKVRW